MAGKKRSDKKHVSFDFSGGEHMQNCQNEDAGLDVTYFCARIKDKVNIVWELKPVEPPKPRYGAPDVQYRNPLRLVCVIDVSHSMEEPYGPDESVSKLDKMKLFAQLLIKTISEDDFVGLVTFGTKAHVIFPLKKMAPEAKEEAMQAIDEIKLGGVTNPGAGLVTGVELFRTPFSKSRFFNDNMLLFSDGMANEGITESSEMVREVRKRVHGIREECNFDEDYTVKIFSLGTGGFLPELLYDIGQTFSSDAFYFLDETASLELNLMRPILYRQSALVSCLSITVTALNGVVLDKKDMPHEYEELDPDGNLVAGDNVMDYYLYDIPVDMPKHLVCALRLPSKHKKALKNKDVLTIEIQYRDSKLAVRTLEKTIAYGEIPRKERFTLEKNLLVTAQHETRFQAQKALKMAAEQVQKLNRSGAKAIIQTGANDIRTYCDHVATLLAEDAQEFLVHYIEPILANLEYCDRFIGDLVIRWDDVWARLMAMASSLGREAPTASGVFTETADVFNPPKFDDKMEEMCCFLRDIYISRGICTEAIDRYHEAIKELQNILKAQSEPEDLCEALELETRLAAKAKELAEMRETEL